MSRLHLNLGCGNHLLPGFVNVDRIEAPGVDQVHDLDTPWPWADGSVDRVEAKDVFEHVADPILFMTEAWRVLCDGGTLFIRTPHYQHRDAFTDPTHKRFPTEHTFDYWITGTTLFKLHYPFYGAAAFHRDAMQMDGGSMLIFLSKIGEERNATYRSEIDRDRGDAPVLQFRSRDHRGLAAGDGGHVRADRVRAVAGAVLAAGPDGGW